MQNDENMQPRGLAPGMCSTEEGHQSVMGACAGSALATDQMGHRSQADPGGLPQLPRVLPGKPGFHRNGWTAELSRHGGRAQEGCRAGRRGREAQPAAAAECQGKSSASTSAGSHFLSNPGGNCPCPRLRRAGGGHSPDQEPGGPHPSPENGPSTPLYRRER